MTLPASKKRRPPRAQRRSNGFGQAAAVAPAAGSPPAPAPSRPHPLLNPRQLAEILQVSPRRIMKAVQAGEIPSLQLGPKMHRFEYGEVIAALKRRRDGQA